MTVEEITESILRLKPEEREMILNNVMASLIPLSTDSGEDNEEVLSELLRRKNDMTSAAVEGIPMNVAFARARAAIV
jgi:hypothetical protein